MQIITRSQFLKDLRKGWKGLKFHRGDFYKHADNGTVICACAIGAAATGVGRLAEDYYEDLPPTVVYRIARTNDKCSSKAEAMHKIIDLKWPKKYAA